VAGEVATTVDLLQRFPNADDRAWVLQTAWLQYEMAMQLERPKTPPDTHTAFRLPPTGGGLGAALADKLHYPFTLDWQSDPSSVIIRVHLPDVVLSVQAPIKRLYTGAVWLFLVWLVGAAALVFAIAALFMRNQVRAIRRLAGAAEAFGMGRDQGPIRPEGASEVRQAATAFNRMQERIRRFLQQRTEMLAGVSHDLRTPLTRLRLALAMMPANGDLRQEVTEMTADVEEMERMIGGYLAFARGEGAEQVRPTDLAAILEDVATGARRAGAEVSLDVPMTLVLPLRPDALRRAVMNLVDNARQHARHVALAAQPLGERAVLVTVDDDGPGIPPDRREGVFRPFESGADGGTGLGLTIARDIVRAHGGDITLEDSPLGGLRANIHLPM
jgi:two-component system osmolarity sensor histidine kinase EnvZ